MARARKTWQQKLEEARAKPGLPKTEWSHLPQSGSATVKVDGRARRAVVRIEKCDCRGKGQHEHRFLSLPPAAAPRPVSG